MYVDSQTTFSDAQAVTSTAISSNVIDLLTLGLGAGSGVGANSTIDIGMGEELYLVVQTAVAVTDTGSDATLAVTLESDTAVGLGSSPVVHYSTGTLAFAAYATAGTQFVAIRLPAGSYKRYLGLRYTVASGPFTAGAFDAFLTTNLQRNLPVYKSGFTAQ